MEMFFSIFNIWLNKIHLCKQTQDKALTKPNKQENKRASPLPGGGIGPACPPLGHSSLAPRGGVILHFPFT